MDGGAPKSFDKIMASLGANAKVNTLFNTHHHVDQTGNNEMFSTGTERRRRSANIMRTSAPWSGCRPTTGFRLTSAMKSPPETARPTETFLTTGSLKRAASRSTTVT